MYGMSLANMLTLVSLVPIFFALLQFLPVYDGRVFLYNSYGWVH